MCGCGDDNGGPAIQVKLNGLLDGVFDRCTEGMFDGLVDRVIDALLEQLSEACPTDNPQSVDGELKQRAGLPTCLSNTVRYAGRQFRRGMFDVEEEHKDGPPTL